MQFRSKIWEQKALNRKAEWIDNIKKELQYVTNMCRDSLRATHKRVPKWKTPGHHDTHGFWFKRAVTLTLE